MLKTGLKEASTDQVLIKQWFSKWPKANIGIATGAVSGIFALDIDHRHNGDDSLDAIRSKYGAIPDDVLAITGSGGQHFLFKHPGQVGRSTTKLWPGIDTRGDGGYIVAAPSNHISGQVYFWDAEADPLNGAILPPCPDWLLVKLAEKSQPTPKTPTTDKLLPSNEVKRLRAALGYIPADDRDQWLQVGMALHASGAGEQAFGLWCEWAQQSGKYDFSDSRRVWGSFKPDGGIHLASIFGIAKINGWIPPQSERPPLASYSDDIAQTSTKPESGGNNINVDCLLERYIFLNNHNRIYDTITRNELSRDGFDGAYAHKFTDKKTSTLFLKDPKTTKVDGLIYLPGETDNPVNRDGAVLWNIWHDPGVILPVEATKEDCEPWLEHLHYLFPDAGSRYFCESLFWASQPNQAAKT